MPFLTLKYKSVAWRTIKGKKVLVTFVTEPSNVQQALVNLGVDSSKVFRPGEGNFWSWDPYYLQDLFQEAARNFEGNRWYAHPDRGGSYELMAALNQNYEILVLRMKQHGFKLGELPPTNVQRISNRFLDLNRCTIQ